MFRMLPWLEVLVRNRLLRFSGLYDCQVIPQPLGARDSWPCCWKWHKRNCLIREIRIKRGTRPQVLTW